MELFFVFWGFAAIGVGLLANARGRSGFGFFLLSALLSPLLGLIVVLVMSNLVEEARKDQERRDEHERQLASIRAIAESKPVPSSVAAAGPAVSVADELAKLGELRDKGVLTPEEFQAQKSRLLGQPVAAPTPVTTPPKTLLQGYCPSCATLIPRESTACPKCKTSLAADGTGWQVKALS